MKKLLTIALMAIMLVGCGGKELKTTKCKGSIDQITEADVVIESDDDKIVTMTSTTTYHLTSYLAQGYTKEDLQERLRNANKDFNGYKGCKSEYVEDGDDYKYVVTVNYEEADIKELQNAGIISGGGNVTYVSLEKTVEDYNKTGLTCE